MSGALSRLSALVLAAVWALQEGLILTGWPAFSQLSLIALLASLILGFIVARTVLRAVSLIALGAAALLAVEFQSTSSLLQGTKSAALFVAFLATMQMLRVAIELGSGIERVQREHEALDLHGQHDSMLFRAWLTGSIFAAGAMAIVAPVVSHTRPDTERRALAQATLQGVALALLWSPFFVAMAVCVRLSTRIDLSQAVANGLAMAALGLAISHLTFGGRLQREWVMPLWRVFAASVCMTCITLAAHAIWGVSNFEAIVAVVPVIALFIARSAIRREARSLALRWTYSLRAIAPEGMLVSAALVLGEVIKDLLERGLVQPPVSLGAWPEPILIAWPSFAMALLSMIGFHPIIGASLLFPLQGSLSALHPIVAAGSVMVGWMLSIIVSRFAVPVLFAASVFRISAAELVGGRTMRFVCLFTPAAWSYLWLLNRLN